MKSQLLRLGSVVPHGVGGPEAGAINLIYSLLLQEYEQDVYSYIGINQIGADLNELVIKEPGNKVYVNIRYPVYDDFENRSIDEQNRIRLDIIHQSLLRIATEFKKLEVNKLEIIKNRILENKFLFDFVYKTYQNKKDKDLTAKIIIHPLTKRFDIYALIEERGKSICNVMIFSGGTDDFYFGSLFANGKWNGTNEFIVTGKKSEVEIHVHIDKCSVEYINILGNSSYAPFFELMKIYDSKELSEKAYQNWIRSLPPGKAAIITHEPS
jgi:hypothetical protein